MKLRPLSVLGLFILCGQICLLSAQTPAELENARFIGALRQRGDFDLARLYLDRLKREAKTPAALEALQLEIAKLRLIEASVEPDSGKRQAMLTEAQQEFEQFLAKNKNHPNAPEIRLEIAQVAVQQGRILLSKALSQETLESQRTEGARARAALEEAGKRLQAVAREMDGQLDGLGQPKDDKEKAERKRLEEQRQQAHLGVAQNLFDQAMTYSRDDQAHFKERGEKVTLAQKELEKIAAGEDNLPQTWTARAWVARCIHENGDPKNARIKLKDINETRVPASAESRRQAKYFLMLALQESDDVKDRVSQMEDIGKEWLRTYDRSYRNTPEGNGVRYLLAEIHLGRAAGAKAKQKDEELNKARTLLTEVEHGDNEFSERARRKKLAVIASQGGFDKKIDELKNFEDCFVRAQYEISLIAEDIKKVKTPEEGEKVRLARIDHVMTALDRALSMPDARTKRSEAGTARAIQAYYALNTKRYRACIRAGEAFAREDATASQAANAAMYALQAYGELVRDQEVTLEKSTGALTDDEGKKVDAATYAKNLADTKKKMIAFARFVEARWPREQAGDLAKHQLAILLFNEKAEGDQKNKDFHDAIKSLSSISRTYPSYGRAMFLLALRSMEADKANLPPVPDGKATSWKQRTLDAFAAIPEPTGEDAETAEQYIRARLILGNEMYKEKKFDELDKMAEALLGKIVLWKLPNEELRSQFKSGMQTLRYFARYGMADAAFQANDHAKVLTVLNPFVDEVKAAKEHPLKSNQSLGHAMLSFALRSAVQTGKMDRALAAAQGLQNLSTDDTDSAATVLGQIVTLITKQLDELKQKKDKARRDQLIKGYSGLLDELTKSAKLTPMYLLRLALCYSSMEQHAKAIDTLNKFPKPKEGDEAAEKLYKSCQLNLVRELRLNKEGKKARPILDPIMGTKEKPGWGARNPDALMESIYLLNEEEKYAEAFAKANAFTKALSSKLDDNTMKGFYLDSYYQMVYAMVKFADASKDPAKKERHIQDAAKQILALNTRFPGYGSDATAKQFDELLQKEPELKKAYDKIKADNPAGK